MMLLDAKIYGFGKWVDYEINFSSESAVCIYGENESGKTTLHHFILFMLFGLPPKQRNFYRPKTSGKMGGRIRLDDTETGEFTIERFDEVQNGAAVCYTADGLEYGEDWLKERLKGMTAKTYQAIFSFSAMDLNLLRDMNEEDLGEVLLGIGLTGSTDIYAVEKKLDTRIGELFKPYGKKPAINRQLESLNELFTSLHNYKSAEGTYREKQEKVTRLQEKMANLQYERNQEKSVQISIEKQQHALPILHDYQQYMKQLREFPAEISFPEKGIERMERMKDNLLPLQSELTVLNENEKKYSKRKAAIRNELEAIPIQQQAEDIIQKKQHYIQIQNELDKNETALLKLDAQINSIIHQLDIQLNEDELNKLSFPFHIEKTWNQIKSEKDQLELEKDQLNQEHYKLKHQRMYVLNEMNELEDGLLSANHEKEMQDKVNEHRENELLNKLRSEADLKRKIWGKEKAKKVQISLTIFTGSMITAVLAAFAAVFMDQNWLFGLGAVLLIAGIAQWIMDKRSTASIEKMLSVEYSGSGGLELSSKERGEIEEVLALNHKKKNELTSLEEQLKSVDIQLIQWKEKEKLLTNKERRTHSLIEEQQETYPFLRSVELSFWPELFHNMKQLLRLIQEKKESKQVYKELSSQLESYLVRVKGFFQERKWETENKTLEFQLKELETFLQNCQKHRAELEHYENILAENKEKQQEIRRKMSVYEIELTSLLKHADVSTEDEFYKKANQSAKKTETEEAVKKVSSQIKAIFSDETWEQFIDAHPDENTLRINLEQSQERITAIEEEIEDCREKLAEVNADLLQMESSDSYSKTVHQFQMEQEHLRSLAKKWAVLKTAKEILIETRKNYRDKYLTEVISNTSSYFQELTGNVYQAVYAPSGNRPFQVETTDHMRYAVNELSKGTIDQLYISLRLAVSELMSEKYRLPFIIDDGFIHFDAIRTKRMIKIIERISRTQQVILFTCKKEVSEASNSVRVIPLKNSVRII